MFSPDLMSVHPNVDNITRDQPDLGDHSASYRLEKKYVKAKTGTWCFQLFMLIIHQIPGEALLCFT